MRSGIFQLNNPVAISCDYFAIPDYDGPYRTFSAGFCRICFFKRFSHKLEVIHSAAFGRNQTLRMRV